MQIKNNYDIYWEKGRKNSNVRYENGTGIFNGEIGRIAYIDNESKQLEVDFDDGKTAVNNVSLNSQNFKYCYTKFVQKKNVNAKRGYSQKWNLSY